jgi:hypothetical protein
MNLKSDAYAPIKRLIPPVPLRPYFNQTTFGDYGLQSNPMKSFYCDANDGNDDPPCDGITPHGQSLTPKSSSHPLIKPCNSPSDYRPRNSPNDFKNDYVIILVSDDHLNSIMKDLGCTLVSIGFSRVVIFNNEFD